MGNRVGLATLTLLAALSSACPFESKTPLGEPAAPVDSRLLGLWTWTDPDSREITRFLVLPFNRSEIYIELSAADEETERFRAYSVEVGDEPILQVQELKPEAPSEPFVFARYSFSDTGELSLHLLDEEGIPKSLAEDPKGLVDYLSQHLDDPALRGEDPPLRLQPQRRQ